MTLPSARLFLSRQPGRIRGGIAASLPKVLHQEITELCEVRASRFAARHQDCGSVSVDRSGNAFGANWTIAASSKYFARAALDDA